MEGLIIFNYQAFFVDSLKFFGDYSIVVNDTQRFILTKKIQNSRPQNSKFKWVQAPTIIKDLVVEDRWRVSSTKLIVIPTSDFRLPTSDFRLQL
jgi:hypothetical protein